MAFLSRLRSRRGWIIALLVAAVVLFFALPSSLVDLLWMQALGYASVFWTTLGIRAGLFGFGFLVVAGYLGVNLWMVLRHDPVRYALEEGRVRWQTSEGELATKLPSVRGYKLIAGAVSAFFGLMFASTLAAQWEDVLRWWYAVPYGSTDPVFGNDLSFYLLELPVVETVQGSLVGLFFLGLLLLAAAYVLLGQLQISRGSLHLPARVVRHLAVNLVLLLAAWAWSYVLGRYDLLYTEGGVVHGASYVDVNVQVPLLWALFALTLLLIGLVLINLRGTRPRLLAAGVALYLILIVASQFVPGLVQQITVEPNELALERPYLKNNVQMTREAYNLEKVQSNPYPAEPDLTLDEVQNEKETLRNIRLWDPRLLIDTYRQIQEIRLYYQFYNVDVGRYMVNGEYRQVMLSARELAGRLPEGSDTWFNRHLQYTHGYGLTMNPVAREGQSGTPDLLIRDIPPVTPSGLNVEQPAVYYGEKTPTYRIVASNAPELDYPQGDDNVYVTYDGHGGVRVGSFWRQVLFTWFTGDANVLLSDYIKDNTRIQFNNRIQNRINKIAPFLKLDRDPYLALADGRMVWIQDAYTTASTFPYSEPVQERFRRGYNYIRNSVKVVVDAYNGDVSFYVMDEDDPVLQTYRSAFPDLFQPISAMNEDVRKHLRYPQDLFDVQVAKYNRYHMTNPKVFYNNEDLWTKPNETYQGNTQQMEPYYILTHLPDSDQLQFMLMTPVTPNNRDNMIGWIAAKSDPPNYGELITYELPKEKLIYGPAQIEAKIDQDTDISRQLTLWSQEGSRAVRGNLIVVPIEDSFLYVEPVFLIAEGAQIPQLKRVIVTYGERVAMRPTLNEALQAIFGGGFGGRKKQPAIAAAGSDTTGAQAGQPTVVRRPAPELGEARRLLQEAREALQQGNFAQFGERFDRLGSVLQETQGSDTSATAAASPSPPAADTTGVPAQPVSN